MSGSFSHIVMQQGRALEWVTSLVLAGFALTLALPGDTLAVSVSYSGFEQIGFEEAALVLLFGVVGAMRCAGLYINGAWRRSPVLRMIGACLGAAIFISSGLVFFVPYALGVSDASTGFSTYLILGVFDILAAYRAAADVRNPQRPVH